MLYDVFINQNIFKMTAEELLKPRFEVIAEYPNTPFSIGDVITFDGIVYGCNQPQKFERHPQDYPHLFRKLNWWEHRKIEDMPKKLHCRAIKGDTEILYIEEWDMDILVGWTNKEKRQCCSLLSFKPEYGYFPVD